jgi:N-methylhydantoinase A
LRTYGYSSPEEPLEIVAARSGAVGRVVKPPLAPLATAGEEPLAGALLERREVALSGTERGEVPVYDRALLRAGHGFEGPALIEQYDSCTYVAPGFAAKVDAYGNLVLERRNG